MAWLIERQGKDHATYYVGCRVNGKPYYTKVIRCDVAGAKKQAEKKLAEIEVAVADGKFLEERRKKGGCGFSDVADQYLADGKTRLKRSYISIVHNIDILKRYFANKPLDLITREDINNFINMRLESKVKNTDRKIKSSTIDKQVIYLSAVFKFAKKYGKIKENTVSGTDKFGGNKRNIYLEKDEIEKLLLAAEESPKYLKPILIIALNTGLRENSILSLKWHDINFKLNQISVREENSKTGVPLHIPMNDIVKAALMKYQKQANSDFIFCDESGKRFKNIGTTLLTTVERSGILKSLRLRTHKDFMLWFGDLRHSFASWWMMEGGDILTLQKILGHKSPQMTQRYAHLAPDFMQAAMNGFSRRFNKTEENTAIPVAIQENFENCNSIDNKELAQIA